MPFAPILVSVYTRINHLVQCIESLKRNPLSSNSILYVVSDGALSPLDQEKVVSVREYVAHIEGFSKVIPILRPFNVGSYESLKSAMTEVLTNHGKAIVLEDDNVVSPNFLSFMNDALDFYEDDQSIFSISGYNYPVKMPRSYPYDVYKWMGYSGWGVGLWKDRWEKVVWDYPPLTELAFGKPLRRELDGIAEHLSRQMIYDITHQKKTGDTMITYYMVKHKLYSIFPIISKVRNVGHDGTGEHAGVSDLYLRQPIDPGLPYQLVRNLPSDEEIDRILRRHFAIPLKARLIMMASSIIPKEQKQWIKDRLYPYQKRR